MELYLYGITLAELLVLGVGVWMLSLQLRDVSIVDSFWSIFIAVAGMSAVYLTRSLYEPHIFIASLLLVIWAVRLSGYITYRNWGQPEDHRYQTIRKNNEPNFNIKSLFIIFWLQAFLASIVALPFIGLVSAPISPAAGPTGWFFGFAALITVFGIVFETIGDWQLYRFLKDKKSGEVMDRGLWRYTRHPNYFGEFCVWWGFFGMALSVGAWWTILSPALMTVLLLKVSGVGLMEKTITESRPKYREYIRRTNAFFPGLPKKATN